MFHPELEFSVPRQSNGEWLADFNPFAGFSWIEGNSWQYTFYVPHDVTHLVELIGKEHFNRRLEDGFEKSYQHCFAAHVFDREQSEAFEFYVNHGNQPNMQAAYLFNHSGQPWLAEICPRHHGALLRHDAISRLARRRGRRPDRRWFVISAMGLFEMNGGVSVRPIVEIGSPLFDLATIKLDSHYYGGRTFVIKAKNNGARNIYIQSAKLNRKPLTGPWFHFDEITSGGKLELVIGAEPNTGWGAPRTRRRTAVRPPFVLLDYRAWDG